MKAWVQSSYGPPEEMELMELPVPEPKRDQVLVRLRAVGLNGSDWELKTGHPGYSRIYGLTSPRVKALGSDIAGTVEEVGPGVTEFKKGDPVFGDIFGTFGGLAEFVAAPASRLLRLPPGLDFTGAAAVPQSAVIAHQAMTRPGPLPRGARLLINGAGGGVGTFALQMATAAGLNVGVVDRAAKLKTLKAMGAREAFDFERTDFTITGLPYNRIIDLWATRGPGAVARSLIKGGQYWAVGGELSALLKIGLFGRFTPATHGRKVAVLTAHQTREALKDVLPLIERGTITPLIDRIYPLAQAPQALTRLGRGLVTGKVVVRVA